MRYLIAFLLFGQTPHDGEIIVEVGTPDPHAASHADGASDEIEAGDLAATGITDGFVLTADGAGASGWEAAAAGVGDVSKVGTPVDNQIGVWTGDGTLEGDANLTWDGSTMVCQGDIDLDTGAGQLILDDGSVGNPALVLGSDDDGSGTGIFRGGANIMSFAVNGINYGEVTPNHWQFAAVVDATQGFHSGDNDKVSLGATYSTQDYWWVYNSAGTQLELWTTDSNGAGLDGEVLSVADGTATVKFYGDIDGTGVSMDWDLEDNQSDPLEIECAGHGSLMQFSCLNDNEQVLVGDGATPADFDRARLHSMWGDTGDTSSLSVERIGIVGEASATTGNIDGIGVHGVSLTSATGDAVAVRAKALVNTSTDTTTAYGVRALSDATHSGGDNVALYASATNSSTNNYGLWVDAGDAQFDEDVVIVGEHSLYAEGYIDAGSQTVGTAAAGSGAWVEIDGCTSGNLNGWTHSACDWTAGASAAGVYLINYSISFSGGAGELYESGVSIGDAIQAGCRTNRKLGGGDVGNTSGACILDISASDVVKPELRGMAGSPSDATVTDVGFTITKI